MNILEKIVAHKKQEVERAKRKVSIAQLEKKEFFRSGVLSFKDFLLREDKNGIIAEFKRRSPSKGVINNKASVNNVINAYAENGASAISVLTDEEFFGGSVNDLIAATNIHLPVLRKEFIVDEYQLIESKAFGASVILLIAACLTKKEVKAFASSAKGLGLNVLLEIHNEQELEHICEDVDVVGVNNRDLTTFNVDVSRSIQLAKLIPLEKIRISESGIDDVATIKLLQQHDYKGFLIGEKFMRESDPANAFRHFATELNHLKK